METKKKTILVLGAGVAGLQTAVSILERVNAGEGYGEGKWDVRVVAEYLPGDRDPRYCSPWAGADGGWGGREEWREREEGGRRIRGKGREEEGDEALERGREGEDGWGGLEGKNGSGGRGEKSFVLQVEQAEWRSHSSRGGGPNPDPDKRVRDWERTTYLSWRAEIERHASTGSKNPTSMAFVECNYFLGNEYQGQEIDEGGVWFEDVVEGYEEPAVDSEMFTGKMGPGWEVRKAVKYRTVCVDVNVYLEYLSKKVVSLGGTITRASLRTTEGLEGLIQDARSLLGKEIDILVNCAGLSARKFLEDDAAGKLYPVRGQTVLVKGEADKCYTFVGVPGREEELCYVIPRPGSGTTVLGGCKQVGMGEEAADEELTGRILGRVRGLGWGVGLLGDGDENKGFDVLSVNVGFRPARKGGARVEKGETIDGVVVLHNYGHSGGGYQCSVGCAEEIVGMIGI
ncbi:D-amino acid oxidase protein [Rutstroemia sp. NJR-2017a BBW]|nr:D-amino acid oxidase protein [Rutstroemia sp. NJR-2017a BBW]